MKRITQSIVIILLLAVALPSQAQKFKVKEGDFTVLKGQRTIIIDFDYSEMSVGKYDKEEDYVNDKVKDKNKKEAGSGDEWSEAWYGNRDKKFEDKYFELFNKYTSKYKLKGTSESDRAKYKLVVKTVHTEPGWNIGISRRPAHINVEYHLFDIASGKSMAMATMDKIPGSGAMGFDFDVSQRLGESYAKAGKETGKFLSKKVLK